MAKIFKVAEDEKCGHCNWKSQNIYLLADSEGQAMKEYHKNERGLCADCLVEMIVGDDCHVSKPE
jgi:hypothetical protein